MKTSFIKGSVQKKAGENSEDIFTIIASTDSIDRQGDSIDQKGWDLANFKSNPVLLWAHDYSALPIGRVSSIEVVDGKLVADFVFATAEANPIAQQVKSLYMEGIVNASSVGFIPKTRSGNIITSAELLELSLVPVPANQDALRLAVKSIDGSELADADKATLKSLLEKGAVADVVDAMDVREQKWNKWDAVSEIVCAFYSVYMDETTSVEDFNKLALETADLFTKLANGETVENSVSKSIGMQSQLEFAEGMKSGKVLSKKNLALLEGSVASMKEAIGAIEELTASVKDEDTEEVKEVVAPTTEAVKTGGVESETVTFSVVDVMKDVQALIRNQDKGNELVLSVVNRFVKAKEDAVVA